MPTIANYPQNLLDEHMNWHMHPGHPELGGRTFQMGSPGSGLEFLTFHRTFVMHFHTWYDVQPGNDQAAVAAWTAIPPELKATPYWNSTQAAAEARITSNNPPFATADELGIFIETGIHNNFLHGAAAAAYGEPLLNDPMTSPLSTHFYQLHGLVTNWWNHWASLQKGLGKEIIDNKHHHKELIKDKDIIDVKHPLKEHIKEIKEHVKELIPDKLIKDKDKDIFEGGPIGNPGDPGPLLGQLSQRVSALENQVASGQAFIRPQERPDVGAQAVAEERPAGGSGRRGSKG
jgi:hypothetical protein